MTEDEIAQVIAGVDLAVQKRIAEELELVYQAIGQVRDELPGLVGVDQLREEFRATVEVMDGTDQAIIAKVLELVDEVHGEEGVSKLAGDVGEAYTRFVRAEATRLGLIGEPRVKGRVKGDVKNGGEHVD